MGIRRTLSVTYRWPVLIGTSTVTFWMMGSVQTVSRCMTCSRSHMFAVSYVRTWLNVALTSCGCLANLYILYDTPFTKQDCISESLLEVEKLLHLPLSDAILVCFSVSILIVFLLQFLNCDCCHCCLPLRRLAM